MNDEHPEQEQFSLDYDDAYRRCVLSVLGLIMKEGHGPDIDMDGAAAKAYVSKEL